MTPSPSPRSSRLRSYGAASVAVPAAYLSLCFLWSTTWIGIKVGLHGAPPLIGAGLRFLLAASCLGAVWVARGGSLRVPGEQRRFVALTALCTFGVPYALVYLGETEVTSGLAAVLFSTMPLYAALLARRFLPGEPLTRLRLAGILLGIAGLVVVFHGGLAIRAGTLAVLAMVGVLAAPAFSAVGQVLARRNVGSLPIPLLLAWAMAGGGVLLLASGLVFEPRRLALDGRTLGSIAYLAVAGSVAGFSLLYWLVARITVVSLSLLNLVLPILALVEGWAVYGESLNLSLALGSVVVASGIGLASLGALRSTRAASDQRADSLRGLERADADPDAADDREQERRRPPEPYAQPRLAALLHAVDALVEAPEDEPPRALPVGGEEDALRDQRRADGDPRPARPARVADGVEVEAERRHE
jgi:drug/metabolite transporter (DMT)-like permease